MIKIIDDFLPVDYFDEVQRVLLGCECPWYYNDVVTENEPSDDFYFVSPVFVDQQWYGELVPLIQPMISRLELNELIRVKCNLYPNIGEKKEDPMHVDYPFPHQSAIFYVNANNGYTKFNDNTMIYPVANRLVIFDGTIPHCSSRCTDSKIRVNINFNYI